MGLEVDRHPDVAHPESTDRTMDSRCIEKRPFKIGRVKSGNSKKKSFGQDNGKVDM